jgi:hypothetical protein
MKRETTYENVSNCAASARQSEDHRVRLQAGQPSAAHPRTGKAIAKWAGMVRGTRQTGRRRLDRYILYTRACGIHTLNQFEDATPSLITVDEALAAGYLQVQTYATLQGQRIPVKMVQPVHVSDEMILRGYESPEQMGRRNASDYLKAVANVRHPYWRKYYTPLGHSRLKAG